MGTRLRGRPTWDDGPKSENDMIDQASPIFGCYAIGQMMTRGPDLHKAAPICVSWVLSTMFTKRASKEKLAGKSTILQPNKPLKRRVCHAHHAPPAALASSVFTFRDLNPKQPAAEFRPIQMPWITRTRRVASSCFSSHVCLAWPAPAAPIHGVISYPSRAKRRRSARWRWCTAGTCSARCSRARSPRYHRSRPRRRFTGCGQLIASLFATSPGCGHHRHGLVLLVAAAGYILLDALRESIPR
jgi:hypothetical protein